MPLWGPAAHRRKALVACNYSSSQSAKARRLCVRRRLFGREPLAEFAQFRKRRQPWLTEFKTKFRQARTADERERQPGIGQRIVFERAHYKAKAKHWVFWHARRLGEVNRNRRAVLVNRPPNARRPRATGAQGDVVLGAGFDLKCHSVWRVASSE